MSLRIFDYQTGKFRGNSPVKIRPSASAPAAGWVYRDATNTGIVGAGVTEAMLTTYTGPTTITAAGTTLYRQKIDSGLNIAADNVTVDQCLITASGTGTYVINWAAKADGSKPTGFIIRDSTVNGGGVAGVDASPYPNGYAPSAQLEPGWGYTIQRCNMYGTVDLLKPQDNWIATLGDPGLPILVEDSYFHTPIRYYTATATSTHNDGTQIAGSGGTDVTVRRNTFDGYRLKPDGTTYDYVSSIAAQMGSFPLNADGTTKAILRNILYVNNYFNGTGYHFTLAKNNGCAEITGCSITGNRLGPNTKYRLLNGNAAASNGGTFAVSDNVWDFTGTTDGGLAVVEGQLA